MTNDTTTPTVTRDDMVEFIFAQPPGKRLKMNEYFADAKCGCLMVQYGRAQGWNFYACCTESWYYRNPFDNASIDTDIAQLDGFGFDFLFDNWIEDLSTVTHYGQLHQRLQDKQREKYTPQH